MNDDYVIPYILMVYSRFFSFNVLFNLFHSLTQLFYFINSWKSNKIKRVVLRFEPGTLWFNEPGLLPLDHAD